MSDGQHNHPYLEQLIADLDTRLSALEEKPVPPKPTGEFPIAWWGISSPYAILTKARAGFTHNIIWSGDHPTITELDALEDAGVKAIVSLRVDISEHPAIVACIVADEPDNNVGNGVPKGSVEQVRNRVTAAKTLRPDLPIFSTFGSSCAAGDPESVPGYKSLSSLPGDPVEVYKGYSQYLDFAAPQTYTVAADPISPRYKALDGSNTLTAAEAGVRVSTFVPDGLRRAKRLLGKPLWAQLACVKYRGDYGRNPTAGELSSEAQSAINSGCTGIFYFERGPSGWPSEPLVNDPEQLELVTQTIASIQEGR